MEEWRPSPDALLARAQDEEAQKKRGKLKVFFGFAPGVGKTFAMLEAAKRKKAEGIDVVIGLVESHKRAETEALMDGLERLARKEITYRGTLLHEFDVDEALRRKPGLLLVDELAHTNAPGTRHAKRWQDVEEILQSGINVYTTVNVQHLESLNDVVAQITGVTVRETIPDSILEEADELELVDLPPEELLKRLQEGKVYIPDQAARAIESFFRKGNLIALRELSLRHTAERVADQMIDYKRERAIRQTWPAAERLLVCVGPSPFSARLVRATKRLADTLHADWIALYIETPSSSVFTQLEKDRIAETLRLAAELGAQTATSTAEKMSVEILDYARDHNVTKIVTGKPRRRTIRDLLLGSVVDELIWKCGDIDIYVMSGEGEQVKQEIKRTTSRGGSRLDYAWAAAGVALATGVAWMMSRFFAPTNLVMIYLLAVAIVSARFGRGPSIFASCLGVASFDFFFVPPYLTFAVSDTEYVITFAVMLAVGIIISDLTARVRFQARSARQRERSTAALYEMGRLLAATPDRGEMIRAAVERIGSALGAKAGIQLPNAEGRLPEVLHDSSAPGGHDRSVAQWVYDHGKIAGKGTDTLPGAEALYLPIKTAGKTLGVLRLESGVVSEALDPERLRYIEAFCDQIALALERERLTIDAQKAQFQIESERMRNALLSSVSHDLRTPLTVIAGAASSLLEGAVPLEEKSRQELIKDIHEEAQRLDRLVNNLLQMSRLEAGGVRLEKDWHVLEEIVGNALARLEKLLEKHPVSLHISRDLPLVRADEALMEQVFTNILENAIKYTSERTPIEISARAEGKRLIVEFADQGPGLRRGEESRVFEKFYQADPSRAGRGVGLGLAICRSIVEAHGGRMWAANREKGGATFGIELPLDETPPSARDGARE